VLVSVPTERADSWASALDQAGDAVPAQRLGMVAADPALTIQRGDAPVLQLPVAVMRSGYEQAIPRRLRQAAPPPEH
jgi:hypothetical protein